LDNYIKNLAILRIIYPVRAKYDLKLDYLRKPLKLYNEGKLYPLFIDQQISITFIDEACELINKIITEKKTGIYHCCSSDTSTPYELVNYLIEAKYRVKSTVKSISIYNFLKNVDNPLRYPIFGGLNIEKTEKRLNVKYSSCIEIVDKLVEQGIRA
jgi:dTDP-4-dehydrorhamnose reductase